MRQIRLSICAHSLCSISLVYLLYTRLVDPPILVFRIDGTSLFLSGPDIGKYLRITSFIGLTTRTPVDTTLVAFCVSCYPLVLTFDLDPGNLPGCLAIQPFMLSEIAKGSKGVKLFIFASTLIRNAQSSSYSCRRFCIFWLTIVLACGISILDSILDA